MPTFRSERGGRCGGRTSKVGVEVGIQSGLAGVDESQVGGSISKLKDPDFKGSGGKCVVGINGPISWSAAHQKLGSRSRPQNVGNGRADGGKGKRTAMTKDPGTVRVVIAMDISILHVLRGMCKMLNELPIIEDYR